MRFEARTLRFRGWLVTILLLVLLVSPSTAAFKYLREGMTAPGIVGTDIVSNQPIRSDQWLGDNMIVVVFWASWSERSVEQLNDLAAFVNERTEVGCRVIAVNVDG